MKTTALITGASSGLGYEFAKELAKDTNYNLVLIARRQELLEKLKNEILDIWKSHSIDNKIYIFKIDLSKNQDLNALIRKLEYGDIHIDLLINNAGFGSLGKFENSDLDAEINMIKVNCIAPLYLTKYCYPLMQKKGKGVILNICSTAAFQPVPFMSTYSSTKSFLFSFAIRSN